MEEEATWYSLLTEFTTTPVAVGMRAAPENSKDQSRGMMYSKSSKKPIVVANIKARVPNPMHSLMAVRTFLPL